MTLTTKERQKQKSATEDFYNFSLANGILDSSGNWSNDLQKLYMAEEKWKHNAERYDIDADKHYSPVSSRILKLQSAALDEENKQLNPQIAELHNELDPVMKENAFYKLKYMRSHADDGITIEVGDREIIKKIEKLKELEKTVKKNQDNINQKNLAVQGRNDYWDKITGNWINHKRKSTPELYRYSDENYFNELSPREQNEEIEWRKSRGYMPDGGESFITDLWQGLGQGYLKFQRSVGSTLEAEGFGTWLKDYTDEAMAARRHWENTDRGMIFRAASEGLGQMAPGIATTVATGFLTKSPLATAAAAKAAGVGTTYLQTYGDTYYEYKKKMPHLTDGEVRNLAFLSSSLQAGIEVAAGPEKLSAGLAKKIANRGIKETAKSLTKKVGAKEAKNTLSKLAYGMWRFGKAGVRSGNEEGLEEVLQDVIDRGVEALGTKKFNAPTAREIMDNYIGGAVPGFLMGGTIDAAGRAIDARRNVSADQNQDVKDNLSPQPEKAAASQNTTEPVAQPVANEQNALADVPDSAVVGVEPPAVIDAPKAIPEDIPPELNREHSTGLRLAEGVAKDLGLNIRYFDEIDNPNDRNDAARANGWYDTEKNEIWLNRQNPEINPAETLGHELKHFINKKHPELAEKFDKLLSAGLTDTGRAELNNITQQYKDAKFAPEQGKIEFSADTFGKMWTDPEFLRRFSEQAEAMEKGLGEKVLAAIQEFIEMVRKQLKNIGTREAETWFDNFGELRDEAVNMAVAIRRMNGNSTQAENVVSTTGSSNVQSIPLADLQIDPQRFQFKSKADKITGVDESNQIGGEWDPRSAAILYVWEDNQGNKFVVNGHHRFALAKEKNIDKVNAIVDREADGVTAEQARRNGILINIRDGQGDVQDYAEFVRNDNMSEETARKEGILARDKGRSGYIIGHYASDNLYNQFKAGEIKADLTEIIADIARGDEALEAAGLRAVKNNMPVQQLREFLRVLKNTPRVENRTEQGDLFGFDDSAIKTAETLSKLAAKHIKAIAEKVKASKNAIKNPEAAKALQVKVGKDSEKLYNEALKEQQEWQNWYTNERIYNQLLQEAGLTEQQNSPVDAAENNAPQSPDNNGRFNIDSDTPLLTPEEDANDFQLVGETSKDIARREVRERQEELAAQKRRELEARMATPDLDFEGKDSMATTDNIPIEKKQFSLKKNKQVNPIREDGATKEEYQRQLDNYMYDPVVRQQVDAEVDDFIQRNGGEQAVIGLLAGGDFIPGNVHGMAVMQKLLNSKTFATSDAETKNILSDQYMKLGTRLGQMLNARRLGALTLSSRESIQAHINAALVKIDQKKPGNNVRKQIEENTGVNPDALPDDIIDTPEKVDHIGRILGANMASIGDKLYEYWINSILSGPSTHAANILGNTINATYELTGKRFTEALINTVTKRKDGATFGEFKTMLQHLDFKEAWRKAKRAWDLETTGNGGKLETMRTAIGGRTGRIIRMPGRALRAADEFAKAVIYPIETAAMAYREGIAKGLSGQELSSYIEEQLTTPNSTAAKWGSQRAAELTFTEDPGAAIRKMMEMREAGGWFGTALKMFFPFMQTPHNILKQGIRKSPLGVLSLLNEGGKIIRGKRDFDGEFVARTAEQVLAWSALALIYGLDDDDDLPFITGSSPRYGSAEQQFKANKIPPYSIRIGDTYYSYRRIEPLATGLALIADTVQALKDSDNGRDATQISKKLFNSAKQIIVEKSFLDSLGEISRVANDPEYSMVNWGTNFAASWVPNVARQTIQAFDDNVRDYKNRAKGEEFFEEQFKILLGRTGLVKAAPKIDYFGREITKDTLAGAAPLSKLMRLIPIQAITPDENMNRAELLMWRYNQLNPDEPYYPAVPAYYFTRDGKKLYFSGDNYTDYATESGQLALKQINNAFRHGLLDENNPTKEDIELIKKIFSRARQTVKDKMYRQGRYSE